MNHLFHAGRVEMAWSLFRNRPCFPFWQLKKLKKQEKDLTRAAQTNKMRNRSRIQGPEIAGLSEISKNSAACEKGTSIRGVSYRTHCSGPINFRILTTLLQAGHITKGNRG